MKVFLLLFLTLGAFNGKALAKSDCDIIIKNRKFESGNLKKETDKSCEFGLLSGKKHKLTICNQDKAVAEFESHDLVIEKIIPAGNKSIIRTKTIDKGEIYNFVEEFSGFECVFRGV